MSSSVIQKCKQLYGACKTRNLSTEVTPNARYSTKFTRIAVLKGIKNNAFYEKYFYPHMFLRSHGYKHVIYPQRKLSHFQCLYFCTNK